MRRHELSQEDATRMLAGSIRNMAATSGPVFQPWWELCLTIRNGTLYRTNLAQTQMDRIADLDEVLAMSDGEMMRRVAGEG